MNFFFSAFIRLTALKELNLQCKKIDKSHKNELLKICTCKVENNSTSVGFFFFFYIGTNKKLDNINLSFFFIFLF